MDTTTGAECEWEENVSSIKTTIRGIFFMNAIINIENVQSVHKITIYIESPYCMNMF